MIRKLAILALAVVLAALPGCSLFSGSKSKSLDTDMVAPLILDVCERHDRYVREDVRLDETERDVWLRSSFLLRRLIAEAQSQQVVAPIAEPVPDGQ